VSTAFSILPDLKHRLAGAREEAAAADSSLKSRVTRGYRKAIDVIARTAELADEMAERQVESHRRAADEGGRAHRVFAIVGAPRSGKTSTALEIVSRLRGLGYTVGGVVQPAVVERGRCAAYRARDVDTGEERTLARHRRQPQPGEICFVFDDDVWRWAAERIGSGETAADLVVVDELGRLEARGEGHMPSLVADPPAERGAVRLVVVREEFSANIEERIGPFAATLETNDGVVDVDSFVSRISKAIERRG
jgi:hypothetical protein